MRVLPPRSGLQSQAHHEGPMAVDTPLFLKHLHVTGAQRREVLTGWPRPAFAADPRISTDANHEPEVLLAQKGDPVAADKLAVGDDDADQIGVNHLQKALHQGDALAGRRDPALWQKLPHDREGQPSPSNADHEDVDGRAAELPVRAVERHNEVKLKIGQEALDATVVRGRLRCRVQREGNLSKVDRSNFHQRHDEQGAEGEARLVPVDMGLQNLVQSSSFFHDLTGMACASVAWIPLKLQT